MLAGGQLVVMAAGAGLGHRGVIHAGRCGKAVRCMAGITFFAGGDVAGGFAVGNRAVMAAVTGAWRALKDAIDVAEFARRLRVLAG